MKIKNSIKYALAASVMLWAAACTGENDPDGAKPGGPTSDGKVQITVQLDPANFTKPVVSRAGSPIPNPYETTVESILVLICEGDDIDDALCVEAFFAELNGNTMTLSLTPRSGPVWFAFVGNLISEEYLELVDQEIEGGRNQLAQEGLANGYINLGIYSAESAAGMASGNVWSVTCANPNNHPAPFLNYTEGIREMIPMCTVLKSEQGVYPGMQLPGGKLKLTRLTAKVTVESMDEDFEPVSISLHNTPTYGTWFRMTSTIPNISGAGTIQHDYDPSLVVPGTEMALYPFESSKENPSGLLLKARYNGEEYYYPMQFISGGSFIDIRRNHHYKFVIKEGFEGLRYDEIDWNNLGVLFDNLNSENYFRVDVVDMSTHTMIAERDYFMGVSNEELIVMAERGVEINDILAATVTTNFSYQLDTSDQHIYEEQVTIEDENHNLNLPYSLDDVGSTDIWISIPADVNEGKITISVGNLTRNVHIKRVSPWTFTEAGYLLGTDILHAAVEESGEDEWLIGFSTNPGGKPEPILTRNSKGKVYMHTKNVEGNCDATFFYTREGGGRTKVLASVRPS